MNKVPPEEYYNSLPKKRMASGVLLFNDKNELLVVKPNYKDGWSIPGGVVDENESPHAAAIRETQEEIGVTVRTLDLVCVDYAAPHGIKTESLQFIFFGGTLDDVQISSIKLQESEIDEYSFVPTATVMSMLRPGLRDRIQECLEALKSKRVVYRESR